MLKYSLVKNWESGPSIPASGNTQNLISDTGAIWTGLNIGDFASEFANTNTMPRTAMIKVSLASGMQMVDVAYDDEPTWAGQTGFYTICSNDLTIANTGPTFNSSNGAFNYTYEGSAPMKTPEDFGVDSETGIFNCDDANAWNGTTTNTWTSTGDFSTTHYNNIAFETEYDPNTGGDNYNLSVLMSQNPDYVQQFGDNAGQPTQASVPSAARYKKFTGLGYNWHGNNNIGNTMGSGYIKSVAMFDTVGRTGSLGLANTRGLQFNEVLVLIRFKDDFTLSEQILTGGVGIHPMDGWEGGLHQRIGLEILGRPKFTHASPTGGADGGDQFGSSGGSSSQFRIKPQVRTNGAFKISYNVDDDVDVVIQPLQSWTSVLQKNTHNSIAQSNNKDTFLMSGPHTMGRPLKMGKLKITAPTGKYFTKIPYLKTRSNNIKLKVVDKRKVLNALNNKTLIDYYCFEIIYKSEVKTSKESNINTDLIHSTADVPVEKTGIYRVEFGNKNINTNGDSRTITIYGSPKAKFSIAVNEGFPEEISYGGTDGGNLLIEPTSEVSILSIPTHNYINNMGVKMAVIQGEINSNGKYSFLQKFPSTTVQKTRVLTGATASQFDLVKPYQNIRKGDHVECESFAKTETVKVHTINTERMELDGSYTLETNEAVRFKRSRYYIIRLLPELHDGTAVTLNEPINEYSKLYQRHKTVITLSHLALSGVAIARNNTENTSLSAAAPFVLKFSGSVFSNKVLSARTNFGGGSNYGNYDSVKRKKMELFIQLSDTNDRITAVKTPIFNSKNQDKSDWTNSVAAKNGGTLMNVTGFTHTAVNTSYTITLSWWFNIERVGVRDVTMTLDLDDILTIQDN